MIKRPLHPQFAQPVLEGRKFTTIRSKPWPIGTPIMLYHWSGAAYRSKHIDVAAIIVDEVQPIEIDMPKFGSPHYTPHKLDCGCPLWVSEGFASQDDMDSWFYQLVKPGQTITKALMKFRLQRRRAPSGWGENDDMKKEDQTKKDEAKTPSESACGAASCSPGFYWVKVYDEEITVAEWDDDMWHYIGSEVPVDPKDEPGAIIVMGPVKPFQENAPVMAPGSAVPDSESTNQDGR